MFVCVTGGRGAGEPAGEEQLPPNGVRPLLATTIRPTRPPTIGQNQRPASPFHLYCSVSSVYHDENSLWFKEMRSISMLANICRGGEERWAPLRNTRSTLPPVSAVWKPVEASGSQQCWPSTLFSPHCQQYCYCCRCYNGKIQCEYQTAK